MEQQNVWNTDYVGLLFCKDIIAYFLRIIPKTCASVEARNLSSWTWKITKLPTMLEGEVTDSSLSTRAEWKKKVPFVRNFINSASTTQSTNLLTESAIIWLFIQTTNIKLWNECDQSISARAKKQKAKKEKKSCDCDGKRQSVNIKMIQFKLMFRCFNFHFNLFVFCNSNYQSLEPIALYLVFTERRACDWV